MPTDDRVEDIFFAIIPDLPTPDKIIFPLYIEEQANPVIFPKKYFSEILDFEGDIGCKKIIKKYHEDTIGVSLNSDEVVVDCDTMDDYFLIEKKLQNNVQT